MTIEEFHNSRKPFYIDPDTLDVKFPTQKHMATSHAVWFTELGYPYVHTVRGYYKEGKEEGEESYVMLYWNDFEVPNIVIQSFPYLFEYFPKIKWIGLGCHKGKPGEVWPPKFKIYKNDAGSI